MSIEKAEWLHSTNLSRALASSLACQSDPVHHHNNLGGGGTKFCHSTLQWNGTLTSNCRRTSYWAATPSQIWTQSFLRQCVIEVAARQQTLRQSGKKRRLQGRTVRLCHCYAQDYAGALWALAWKPTLEDTRNNPIVFRSTPCCIVK